MPRLPLALALLALAGCQGVSVRPGPAPTPTPLSFRVVTHVSGSGDIQSFVGSTPYSAFLRWSGNGTIEAVVDAMGVVLYLDGDSTFIVEPVAGREAEAAQAVAMGRVVMRGGTLAVPNVIPVPPTPLESHK